MPFFKKLLPALGCAALSALTTVLILAAMLLNTARRQIEAIPGIVHNELEAARGDVHEAVRTVSVMLDVNIAGATTDLNNTLNRQADAARAVIDAQLNGVRADVNRGVEAAFARVDAQLTKTNDAIAEFASVAAPARAAITKVDSALPFYTDCDAGMCVANVIYGIGKETERTMRSVDKTMTVIAAKSPTVAESIEKGAAAMELRSRQSILRNLFSNLKPASK